MRPTTAVTSAILLVIPGLLAWLCVACDNPARPAPPAYPTLETAVASDPALRNAAAGSSSRSVAVTYVSLPPGSLTDATSVTLSNRATGATASVRVANGGFDPVAIEASGDDTLKVVVEAPSGQAQYRAMVPARRRPVVVRTNPTKGKRDVPLNLVLNVVFSEPIDPASISATSVRLRLGDQDVAAHIGFVDGEHLVLSVAASAPLQPLSDYVLSITDEVRDADGEALEAPLVLAFTTEYREPTGISALVSTTGSSQSDRDPDGYELYIDDDYRGVLPSSGSRFFAVAPGTHRVVVGGLSNSCGEMMTNPDTVVVQAGQVAIFNVNVACGGGFARVDVTTTGDAEFGGYHVSASGWDYVPDRPVTPNGSVVVRDRPGIGRVLAMHGIPEHCEALQDTARTLNLFPGDTVLVAFSFHCAPRFALRLAANAAGPSPDTSGYTVHLTRPGFAEHIVDVPTQGSTTASGLMVGEWLVSVSGIAANCDMAGDNPRVINYATGGTFDLTIDVICQQPTEIAYVGACGGSDLDICVAGSHGGHLRRLTSMAGNEATPKWSPDGSRVVFASGGTNRDIHVIRSDGTGLARLTTDVAADYDPAWSPDGAKIVFVSERNGNPELYVMNADGTGVTRLTTNPGVDEQPAWSPDGQRIAYRSTQLGFGVGNGEILSIRPDGTDVKRLTVDGADDTGPAWSPDGSKIAFARFMSCYGEADIDGVLCDSDIFTIAGDGTGGANRVGGIRRPYIWQGFYYRDDEKRPAWSPDGRKIAVEMTSCASDGHCHPWTGISAFTIGRPGFTDVIIPGYAPSWKR